MCRLARPAGIHDGDTQPLVIQLKQPSNISKRRRAQFNVSIMNECLARKIDEIRSYTSRVAREQMKSVVVWEQHRPETDALFVETNLALACITRCHTNSSIISGQDAGDMVEEYQQSYMTKEKGGLKMGAAVMLTALHDIDRYPSVAEDSGSCIRQAKHLATRTVNAFTGANEWPHALMVYALAGNRSFDSSDTFWYVFPHKLAKYARSGAPSGNDSSSSRDQASESSDDEEPTVQQGIGSVIDEIQDLVNSASTEDCGSFEDPASGRGARMFKVDDQIVFVTQAESYRHRGVWFAAFSALEFEVIVDLLPRRDDDSEARAGPGRPKRRGFDLANEHPLAPHFQGFIRTKFKTPMFGGPPPPPLAKNGTPSDSFSKYVLHLLHPWMIENEVSNLQACSSLLLEVCKSWNRAGASFVNRQRFRVLDNIIQKHTRSSNNEATCSEWRNRNAHFWRGAEIHAAWETRPTENTNLEDRDSEALGLLAPDDVDVLAITTAAAAKDFVSIAATRAMKSSFWSLIPDSVSYRDYSDAHHPPVFDTHLDLGISLTSVARRIHKMLPVSSGFESPLSQSDQAIFDPSSRGPGDNFSGFDDNERQLCSSDQRVVYDFVVGNIEGHGKLRQSLVVLHGGGGTGKSTLIGRISRTLLAHGIQTVNTCPTGVGASHLPNGRTFHSAFKVLQSEELSVNDLELLRLTFTKNVRLVVVDEMSMFSSENLVLLDNRLRAIYRSNIRFGGLSILLAGDFLQLDVTGGTPLCKMLYTKSSFPPLTSARALFREFKVFFLNQQHRAAQCQVQQAILEACRALPSFYPTGVKYTAQQCRNFAPITNDLLRAITRQLTMEDIARDPAWLDEMTILVTGNFDKAALTACTSRLFAKRHRRLLFRWRRQLKTKVPPELALLIYDEDAHPELFAYFVVGAQAQVLDNNNGNVSLGVANGTPCRMHSLSWEDGSRSAIVHQLIEESELTRNTLVDLPFPPDFINVQLVDMEGNARPSSDWPDENNLETRRINQVNCGGAPKESVIIPIGLMGSKSKIRSLQLGRGMLSTTHKLQFLQHAVDISFVMTVWKAQGSTLKRVVLNLEPCLPTAPKWGFEHIYVAISRVRATEFLRCLPLSGAFRIAKLANRRPNIFTTKWRLDHGQLRDMD